VSFHDQIRKDFDKVLLDTQVFGRVCSWNGKLLKVAEDARSGLQTDIAQGSNREIKIIYCRDIDLIPAPVVTEEISLDGEIWYVDEVKKPIGHLIITLGRNVV